MNTVRDTILVIGPSASGKTRILNEIRAFMADLDVRQVYEPHSDSHTILERMREDDLRGGRGHYHPWCPGNIEGHSHTNGEPEIPFTVAGNGIAHGTMRDFFEGLAQLPYIGKLRYAEWSGGRNINLPDEPASLTDLSFTTVGQLLREGQLPKQGLLRVLTVVHPITESNLRWALNQQRHLPSAEEIRLGTASWPLNETAMRIFGEDDFDSLLPLFSEMGITDINSLLNDGEAILGEGLRQVLPGVVEMWMGHRVKKESRAIGGFREREHR